MPHRFTYRGRRLAGEGPGELTVYLGPRNRRRGPGGLGHIALQLLRCMTNAVIIAADVAESKLRLAEKMGAHRVVDARRDPVKQVMDITGNRGADVVIDLVGNDLTLANGMKMLHKG